MKLLLTTLSICLLAALPAAAAESHIGTVVRVDHHQVVVDTNSGRRTIGWTADLERPEGLERGDAVVVRFDADDPTEILVVDDQVQVAEDLPDQYHAIAGTLQEVNPDHMILKTPSGQEAFVIYPERLFHPMPSEGQRVAVVYRDTGTTTKYSQYAASEIIELDDSFQLSAGSVEVSYEPVKPEPQETQIADAVSSDDFETTMTEEEMPAETTTGPARTYESDSQQPATRQALPQTASHLPLIGLLGLLAALGAIALAIRR